MSDKTNDSPPQATADWEELLAVVEEVPVAPPPSDREREEWAALPIDANVSISKGAIEDLISCLNRLILIPLEAVMISTSASRGDVEQFDERMKKLARSMAELEQKIALLRTTVISRTVGGGHE